MASELDPAVLAAVRAGMGKVKVPHAQDKVYKDECLYSFDTPFTPATGLYVNLATWGGVGQAMLGFDSQRTGNTLYAHLRYTKVPVEEAAEGEEKKEGGGNNEATVLGLGVEGGFKLDSQKYDVVKEYALAVLSAPGDVASLVEVPFPNLALPEFVSTAVQAIIDHQGAASQGDEAAWLAEEEPRPVSKYAEALPQLDNGVKISADPSTWQCAESGQAENLWLNLSTGYIGSGRPQLVNDKMIGTGAALKHFEATGNQFPLVVKLGTITPHGADVYSYAPDEDCMVTDPKLAEHLAHWGIDAMKMEKTDKSLAELEIESQKWAFSRITEAGAALTPLRGPGYVGLKNLGNSCYMNSVLQLLFTLPEVKRQYLDRYDAIVKERAVADPASDVLTQTAKLALGLCSDRYSPEATPEEIAAAAASKDSDFTQSVEPRMFKALVGKGHPEFSSGRQQDAQEYLDHLLETLMKAERRGLGGEFYTAALFNFQVEDRLQCQGSGKVRYSTRKAEPQLHLAIPLAAATNSAEVAQYQERKQKRQKLAEEAKTTAGGNGNGNGGAPQAVETASAAGAPAATKADKEKEKEEEEPEVVPVVPFEACLASSFANPQLIEDYASPALPATAPRTSAVKTQRFKNFPPYLVVHLQRYYVDTATWQGKKMEVSVPMPLELDLSQLRGQGQQPGEELLPDAPDTASSAPAAAAPSGPQPDEGMAAQMADFGFSGNAAKRALVAVGNASVEAAVAWLLEHSGDPDINDPLPDPNAAGASASGGGGGGSDAYKAEAANLAGMLGFSEQQALAALTATNGSVERAADWLYSHMDNMDAAVAEVLGGGGGGGGGGDAGAGQAKEVELGDGEGRYELVGFASHVGKNLGSGHYVAHIRKGGRWVIFDDQKVAVSEKPPLDLGYLYLYRRRDGMEMD